MVGDAIKTLRVALGMTQVELAERVGIHAVSLSRIESNQSYPHRKTLDRLAGVLGVTRTELESGELRLKTPARPAPREPRQPPLSDLVTHLDQSGLSAILGVTPDERRMLSLIPAGAFPHHTKEALALIVAAMRCSEQKS